MHYFIDGYNLMFRILRAGDDLQTQRKTIIRELNRKIQALNLDVTLVFDAHYQREESSRYHLSNLEICFSAKGESADEFILHKLRHEKKPRQQTVVTSDKKLAWLARRQGSLTETIEEFLKWLNNRYKNKIKRTKKPLQAISTPERVELPLAAPPSSPEEGSDYYLQQFEMRFQEMVKQEPLPKEKETVKKKKTARIKKATEDKGLSNMDRWQKAFERNLDENEM